MPCEICGLNVPRDYTHSRDPRHFRILIKIVRDKVKNGFYKQ